MLQWSRFANAIDPSAPSADEQFTLSDRGDQPDAEQSTDERLKDARTRTERALTHIENLVEALDEGKQAVDAAGDLSPDICTNLDQLKSIFGLPANKDVVIRPLHVRTEPPVEAAVIYLDGMASSDRINVAIQTMMNLPRIGGQEKAEPLEEELPDQPDGKECRAPADRSKPGWTVSLERVQRELMASATAGIIHDLQACTDAVLIGDAVILIDGQKGALQIDVKNYPVRSVNEPATERTVWGPRDSFIESVRPNTALIRRRVKDPRLTTEFITVGRVSRSWVGLMHIRGLTSPKLVAEVKRRLTALDLDMLDSVGVLQQCIEDQPNSILPGTLVTERPDRVASYLTEGHVVLLLDTNSQALVCPTTFWSLMQSAEDYNIRPWTATVLRWLRLFGLLIAIFMPAVYIAVVNFHQDMLPTELLHFIAESRQAVPMPSVVELFAMDVSFWLILEATTRIPSALGSTIGLIASLIIGQSIVQAKIVSPVLLIVIAITSLAAFVVPNYITGLGIRLVRGVLVLAAAVLGMYGLAILFFILLLYLTQLRTLGVPFLSPLAPLTRPVSEVGNMPPYYEMETRPGYARPIDERRQPPVVRAWDQDSFGRREDGSSKGDEQK